MAGRVVVLDSVKQEFRDIKAHVTGAFGSDVWRTVNAEYKNAMALIKANPEIGRSIDALQEMGVPHIKCILVRQARVVHEFDDQVVIIHMFIATRRDFRSHLLKRALSHRRFVAVEWLGGDGPHVVGPAIRLQPA